MEGNGGGPRLTLVDDIALPVELVELEHLRTRDGQPVVVRCEAVSELVLAEVFMALPGERPPDVLVDQHEQARDPVEAMRAMNLYAPRLLEAGTVLAGPDGDVRPAFYFDELDAHPGYGHVVRQRHERSLPGRLLRESDKVKLLVTIMRLGGYGGAAAAGVFPAERAGAGDGVGAVEAGAGDGQGTAPADAAGGDPAGGAGV